MGLWKLWIKTHDLNWVLVVLLPSAGRPGNIQQCVQSSGQRDSEDCCFEEGEV